MHTDRQVDRHMHTDRQVDRDMQTVKRRDFYSKKRERVTQREILFLTET